MTYEPTDEQIAAMMAAIRELGGFLLSSEALHLLAAVGPLIARDTLNAAAEAAHRGRWWTEAEANEIAEWLIARAEDGAS